MGPRTAAFEAAFRELLGARHCVAVSSCTAALHLALVTLGIGPGDEVIVPSMTFVATVNAIRYTGAAPVFCDIVGPEDLTVATDSLPKLITDRTRAIVVMHYAGFPCRMAEVMDIAEKNGLKVVEDAAHAVVSEYQGRKLGTIGHVGCFSFFSNKNVSTAEGGMLATDSDAVHGKVKLLRSHGMTTLSYDRARGHGAAYDVVELGYNYRLDDIRASLGVTQLQGLDRDLERRARVRARYLERLASLKGITVPFSSHKGRVSNYIFPVVLNDAGAAKRDEVRQRMHNRGIQTSVHYPAVHRFTIYRRKGVSLPKTEYVADNEISLPMFSRLTDGDVDHIVETLKQCL